MLFLVRPFESQVEQHGPRVLSIGLWRGAAPGRLAVTQLVAVCGIRPIQMPNPQSVRPSRPPRSYLH